MSCCVKDVPRHSPSNPYNYTNVELAKKKKALIDAQRDFPNVPAQWIEWMYDVVEHMPADEAEEIINKGLWETQGVHSEAKGGVLMAAEVLDQP